MTIDLLFHPKRILGALERSPGSAEPSARLARETLFVDVAKATYPTQQYIYTSKGNIMENGLMEHISQRSKNLKIKLKEAVQR